MNFYQNITISEPDAVISGKVKKGWDSIAKPLDGMGRFEEFHSRIGAIQGTIHPDLAKAAVLVFCADNGIVAEGVSQSGQAVTRACAVNLGKRETAVCAMAKEAGVEVIPVDIGIAEPSEQKNSPDADFVAGQCGRSKAGGDSKEEYEKDIIPGVLNRKVSFGTRDFLKEPAMTPEETELGIRTGITLVQECRKQGIRILGIGELGIGNTTTSACVTSALLGCDPYSVVGRGAGLSDAGLIRKRKVVCQGLEKWGYTLDRGSCPADHALDVLQHVGGLDIAGMAGACIGGAEYHVPIVLDGVISMTAAIVAERMVPGVKDYLIPSHASREPAARLIADELELHPVLDAGMALGEGTGAVMMLSLLKLADSVYRNCVPFEESGVEAYHRFT